MSSSSSFIFSLFSASFLSFFPFRSLSFVPFRFTQLQTLSLCAILIAGRPRNLSHRSPFPPSPLLSSLSLSLYSPLCNSSMQLHSLLLNFSLSLSLSPTAAAHLIRYCRFPEESGTREWANEFEQYTNAVPPVQIRVMTHEQGERFHATLLPFDLMFAPFSFSTQDTHM